MKKEDIFHSPAENYRWVNRTLCSVLSEMRECYKTRNFAILPGLIEEAQTYGNRMEAKLEDNSAEDDLNKRLKKLKEEIKNLEGRKNNLLAKIKLAEEAGE